MVDEVTDAELAAQVSRGNDGAFSTLMSRYERPILNFVYRVIGDAAEAQDVAQEVFVRVYRALGAGRYRPRVGTFSTWLYQAARHASIDVLRKRKRRPLDLFSGLEDQGESLPAAGPTADEAAANREMGQQIATAIARLPEDQRTVFILAEYQGLSYAEISAVMNCSVKSVESRLYRAKKALRSALAAFRE